MHDLQEVDYDRVDPDSQDSSEEEKKEMMEEADWEVSNEAVYFELSRQESFG